MLDTSVYIDQMQDRSPRILDDLVAGRQVNHSTVAIQELNHTVGVLNPSDPRSARVIDEIGKQIKAMPQQRTDDTAGRQTEAAREFAALFHLVNGAVRQRD